MKKAGVMGWPVDHSRSPALHGFWLKQLGIDGSYERLPVKPEDLATALRALPEKGFAGCNLTVPHKEAAMAIVDQVLPEAQRIGAVNTVFVAKNGQLVAMNTDAFGFLMNLKTGYPGFQAADKPTLVLGAGGASRAVCVALQTDKVPQIYLTNRNEERAQALAKTLGGNIKVIPWDKKTDVLKDVGLVVNTTTLGMKGQPPLELDLSRLSTKAIVNDIVYVPLETPLLAAASARGNPVVDGLGMLLYQAQLGFEGWFGKLPEVTPELRAHVLAAG